MQALIWYETAFIFGCLAPLMAVLVAAQLYADAIAFEWKLRRAPSTTMPSWWGAKPLPILRGVLKVHLVLVLFLQSAMLVFFFVDNRLRGGWQIVAVVVPTLFVADTAYSGEERGQLSHKAGDPWSPSSRSSTSSSNEARSVGEVHEPVVGIGTTAQSPMHHRDGEYLWTRIEDLSRV